MCLVSCQPSPGEETEISSYKQFETISLTFEGPETTESAEDNPFLNYVLQVQFTQLEITYNIRGFYAADGQAAESSAEAGKIWEVRFNPDRVGEWTYTATLYKGENIALAEDLSQGTVVAISNAEGGFEVIAHTDESHSFKAKGYVEVDQDYFRFRNSDEYWLKIGANSPENLLAYQDFDDTYRLQAEAREGEAATNEEIHTFEPHFQDWVEGDPTWQDGKGKAIIGAVNYLAAKGMNSIYFLTMNITGDGKDVWPYRDPQDFTRFDVSKLAQWEIVFEHMQQKGILLHVVLQETENELLLDDGDTGPMRQLYFQELIARFGHHPGLIWNLGEENGPAPFSPHGQNDDQRRAMVDFFEKNDPYQHPILLHTHASPREREEILTPLIGYPGLDGLSLQVGERTRAAAVVEEWKSKSAEEGMWLISMDEIGKWHTGALTDSLTPEHDSLRQYVLWGTLLSGAAGVEWYFGGRYPHNDLNSEDWRQRDRLWELSKIAKDFFDEYLPYWEMEPHHKLISSEEAYCLAKMGEVYAIYIPDAKSYEIDITEIEGNFNVQWYDPLKGGELQEGSILNIKGGSTQSLGDPPNSSDSDKQDWVALIRRSSTL